MTNKAQAHAPVPSSATRRHGERRPAASGGAGLGGNTVAHIVVQNCPQIPVGTGVVIEHLDAQAGTWQFSTDEGQTWRAIRTDLVNRPGNLGLALDSSVRVRVLPFGGHRVSGVRVAFHTVPRSHGKGNGCYRAYASDEREDGSATVTLVLSLGAINGTPPVVHVPRPRNKRALVQRAAAMAAASGSAGNGLTGSMALA